MQVSNSLSFSDLKTVSTQSVPSADRSAQPASRNSSSSISFATLAPDVVTFANPVSVSESSDLLPQVDQTGNTPDISRDTNQITTNQENIGTEQSQTISGNRSADDSGEINSADTSDSGANETDEGGQENNTVVGRSSNESGDNENDGELTRQELQQVAELVARDAEVRAHERAHKAAGGQYAGTISYSFQQGPDGRRYAIGGEVPIDVAPISGDPQATIDKMRTVRSAALAPSSPSPQDRVVASTAGRLLVQAQVALAEQTRAEQAEQQAAQNDDPNEANNNFITGTGVQALQQYQSVVGLETEPNRVSETIDEMI